MRQGKTRVFVLIVILGNVLGNSLLSMGMQRGGAAGAGSVWGYARAILSPLVAAGAAALAVSMFSQMALMSWADLSYIVPVTALAYVLTAIVGRVFLHDQVSALHWVGIALITAGVALVAQSAPGGTEW